MEFWTPSGLSYAASGIGKPLYADKVTEERKRLGFARVLVEIDITSECPKEIVIGRENGDTINVGVEYPWLPPKCSVCGGFGHAAYACAKKGEKEAKVWIPKLQKVVSVRTNSPHSKQNLSFDRTIRKPAEKAMQRPSTENKTKKKDGKLRQSNSFEKIGLEDTVDEEFTLRSPITFMDAFEKAMSSKDKGKLKVGENEVRGFSPTNI